jgi:hypothetical protein
MVQAGLWWLGTTLVVLWLAQAASEQSAARERAQLTALALVLYPLATVVLPWQARWLAGDDVRRGLGWSYLLPLGPAGCVLLATLWVGWPARGFSPWVGAVLLLGYGLLLVALADLSRWVSAASGQMIPVATGVLLCGSVLWGATAVERAGDEALRAQTIAWLVNVNPLLLACAALPEEFDPLRMTLVYSRTPIGAFYMYERPEWWPGLLGYLTSAAAIAGAAYGLRRWGRWS